MANRIEHNADQNRFEIYVDGALAGYAEYIESNGVRDFGHTVTDPDFRGRGLAGQVVKAALDTSREQGFKIVPSCSYVAKYVESHPDYADLVA
ncbi:GNAT family N-acetyltransferase [Rhodococcus xishaensis]|uniref:N-acetyltransferase n=1 Tax=Rhodococcus xishaensis TaxID=2487364 RepID=A0A3S3BJW8_9NOCA|nr:GNAT family N-acetyltransferase [Rhodococcus xishaensis]RVW03108.1 N-acetyltransferase [Rhodococcus xishaensis]